MNNPVGWNRASETAKAQRAYLKRYCNSATGSVQLAIPSPHRVVPGGKDPVPPPWRSTLPSSSPSLVESIRLVKRLRMVLEPFYD